jgi:Tfp pilus assembly protein PilX
MTQRDKLRSIKPTFRAGRNSSERGFALLVALILAVLYFGFVELLMMDASREMSEARRFRGRIVALTLAENGAELAAEQMVSRKSATVELQDFQGTASGTLKTGVAGMVQDEGGAMHEEAGFDLIAKARSSGPEPSSAVCHIEGVIRDKTQLRILFTRHSQ